MYVTWTGVGRFVGGGGLTYPGAGRAVGGGVELR